jgi:hypothetical protein
VLSIRHSRLLLAGTVPLMFLFHFEGLSAQDASSAPQIANVSMIVTDPSGAVIPHAKLEFQGGKSLITKTAEDGSVRVALPYGRYDITIESSGFQLGKVLGFSAQVPNPPDLNVVLQIGQYCDDCCEPLCVAGIQTTTSDLPNVIEPEAVRIPDDATALKIAEPALIKTYGKRHIDRERPLTATLEQGIWTVAGTLYCSDHKGHRTCQQCICFGGVAVLKLRQSDGKILSITHYK